MTKAKPLTTILISLLIWQGVLAAQEIKQATTLSDESIKFVKADRHYAKIERDQVQIVVVNNQAVDDETLQGHRAGYSGIASIRHRNSKQEDNLFVPAYAGLNFEHIHDGTTQKREVLFEPRHAPMELRLIDEFTVELYQAPTPHYGLESVHRYHLLEDGTIEMTFECIPHRDSFRNGYIGLFWASYINQPESLDIHFKGRLKERGKKEATWIRGVTPSHGTKSTHVSEQDKRSFVHDEDFPLSLVFNRSDYVYAEPWYYGVRNKKALVLMFRPQDQIRLTQSPSGGGKGNPAWDFQFMIDKYQIGKRYQFVMRAKYLPFRNRKQIEETTTKHRAALNAKE